MITTTKTGLHPELETRLLSVTVDDTPAQTRQILLRHAGSESTEPPDLESWHAYQRLLELENPGVTVPFGETLARLCSARAVRLRRDFAQVLVLIKSHALLHLYHRRRDAKGRVIATIEDYKAVWELVAGLIAEGVGASISEATRQTIEIVQELCLGDRETYIAQIARKLGLDESSAWRRVQTAIRKGLLINLEDHPGRRARIVLGEPLPKPETVLPPPESLSGILDDEHISLSDMTATLQPLDISPEKASSSGVVSRIAVGCGIAQPPIPVQASVQSDTELKSLMKTKTVAGLQSNDGGIDSIRPHCVPANETDGNEETEWVA